MNNINFSNVKTAEMKAAEASQAEQEATNKEARDYLASTDWYLVREMEQVFQHHKKLEMPDKKPG